MGAVYLLTCFVSGKQYVGLTSRSPERRFAEHAADSRNKKHHAPLLLTERQRLCYDVTV